MTVYSTQFASGVTPTTGPDLVYTVPAGFRAVLRSFDCFKYTSGVMVCLLSINGLPSTLGAVSPAAQPNAGFASWFGYQVFNAGDQLYLAGNTNGITYLLSGYLLIAP
ncbi:MAG TPA: hypothetical protein VF969_08235 [Burkholderiales bacterium]